MVSTKWQSAIFDSQMEPFLFLFLPLCRQCAGLVGVKGGGGYETGECEFLPGPERYGRGRGAGKGV